MNCSRLTTLLCPPRNRLMKCPIHFENTHAVAVAFEFASIRSRETSACDLQQLSRRDVQQNGARRWKLIERFHPTAGNNLTSMRLQYRKQRIGKMLRAASNERPANSMPENRQCKSHARSGEIVQWKHRVGRQSGKKCSRVLSFEMTMGESPRRPNRLLTKFRKQKRMMWEAYGSKRVFQEFLPPRKKILNQTLIISIIAGKSSSRLFQRGIQDGGRAIVEWMRQSCRRKDPLQAMLLQRQGKEKRRRHSQWIN